MSRKSHPITLLNTQKSRNEFGEVEEDKEILNRRTILAERKSIKQSEFYQAYTAGLKPEISFVVWSAEYKDERKLEYNGVVYDIIRTYEKNEKETELICSKYPVGVPNG